jgi:serine/threonine-protein kinase
MSRSLAPDMMAEAAWRLGWLGLLYAGTTVLGYYGRRVLIGLSGPTVLAPRFEDWFGLGSIALGIAMYAVSRHGFLSLTRLLDIGLVFEVLASFGISMIEFWQETPSNFQFTFIPVECVWIVAFPLIVPNTPRKILVSSLLAASTGPVAFVIAGVATGRGIERPLTFAAYFLTTTYLCAVVAYGLALIVHRFSVRLRHAREIGSYELIERIGEGGMGEVWQAKHRLLARPAAIKLIRADVLGSNIRSRNAIIKRFEREAQDTAMLGSTHTIDVYDFGITEGRRLLLCDGTAEGDQPRTIRSRLRSDGVGEARLSPSPGLSFAGRGTWPRAHSPRHQAGQYLPVPSRAGR